MTKQKVRITRTRATYALNPSTKKNAPLFIRKGKDQIRWVFGNEVVVHDWSEERLEWVQS